MAAARLLIARSRARAGVLAGLAAVALVLTATLGTVLGLLAGAPTQGTRSALASAEGVDGAIRWQTRLGVDPAAQAAAADGVLDRLVSAHGAVWERSVRSDPIAIDGAPAGDAASLAVALLADPTFADRAVLVDGSWPDGVAAPGSEVPAAMQADAAAALGAAPGAVLRLDGVPVRIVGTWRALDPGAPAWAGDASVATGRLDDVLGPLVVDESVIAAADVSAAVRWTAVADVPASDADSVAALRRSLPAVAAALADAPGFGSDGISVSGALPESLDRLASGLAAARALAPLPVLLLGTAGLIALARLSALLASSRRRETVLLLARGGSPASLARATAIEASAIGVLPVVVGATVAHLALEQSSTVAASVAWVVWAVAGAMLVVVVAVVSGTAWVDARRPVVRGAGDETGRVRRTFAAGGTVLLALFAAVSLWQFRLYGSPLVPDAAGSTEVDPIAALAPVLVLLVLSIAAVALAVGAIRALEAWSVGRTGLLPSLPLRQLSRRAPTYASAILVLAFATGGLAVTASVDGSWRAFDRSAAAAEVGGEVRLALGGRDVVDGTAPAGVVDLGPVGEGTVAVPVLRGEARVGSDPAVLVALPVDRLSAAAPAAGSPLDPATVDALSADRGPAVGPGAPIAVEVGVRDAGSDADADGRGSPVASADAPAAAIAIWLLDADGAAHRIEAGTASAGWGGVLTATAPDLRGLTLLGVEARLTGGPGRLAVDVSRVADVVPDDDAGLIVTSTSPSARLPLVAADAPVPVVVDRALAADIAADVGDPLEFRLRAGGATVRATVSAVVDVVPAGGDAILADLGAISTTAFASDAGVPEFSEVWVSGGDPVAAADALAAGTGASDVDVRNDASSSPTVAPAVTALWIGAAGASLFALIALAALVAALGTARSGELAVLRALGATPRAQGDARRAEFLGLIAASVAAGVAIGLAIALLTAPGLAGAAVRTGSPGLAPALAPSWSALAAGLVVLLGGCVLVAVAAGRSVRSAARGALPGTEDR